jgi:hypothetical protein
VLVVQVAEPGDFSTYTLRLVQDAERARAQDPESKRPPEGFDPILSAVDFSFKVACPSDFDCKPERICPPETLPETEIDFLAKDYASFRQLMLDRMAVLMPQWKGAAGGLRHRAGGLLAARRRYLSYRQMPWRLTYLGTARRRASVRRHARLVDYFMHGGCNARTWVHVRVRDVLTVWS